MFPVKNPFLIKEKVNDNFYIIANPLISKGLKLINRIQSNILDAADGRTDIALIAKRLNFSVNDAQQVIDMLSKKNYVNNSGRFNLPEFNLKPPKTLNLWIHTTNKCNLACTYCYIDKKKGTNMDRPVIEQLIQKIIASVKRNQLNRVTLRLAGGEPFLRIKTWVPYLRQLRQQLTDMECTLQVSYLTNLIMLNDNIISFFRQERYGIAVSLDGLSHYNGARCFSDGSQSVETVKANLERLIQWGIRPYIMVVVSDHNLNGLKELTTFLVIKKLPFRFSFVKGANINRLRLYDVLDDCLNLIGLHVEQGYEFSKYVKLCDLQFFHPIHRACGSGISSGAIDVDGSIRFCQLMIGKTDTSGSIRDKGDLLSIIKNGEIHRGTLSPSCQTCPYRYFCAAGCPLVMKEGKSTFCDLFKFYIRRALVLIGKERYIKINHSF